jgi:hypothetical protein
MRPIGIARKATYSALFADLAWRKYRAEQYWDNLYFKTIVDCSDGVWSTPV